MHVVPQRPLRSDKKEGSARRDERTRLNIWPEKTAARRDESNPPFARSIEQGVVGGHVNPSKGRKLKLRIKEPGFLLFQVRSRKEVSGPELQAQGNNSRFSLLFCGCELSTACYLEEGRKDGP